MNRKTSTLLFFIFLFSTICFAAKDKKPFTGKIVYEISYPDSDFTQEEISMLPNRMTLYLGKNHLKTSIPNKLGVTEIIFNIEDHSSTALINSTGNKYAITRHQKEKKDQKKPTITITNETKEISGYQCKKAFITPYDENGVPRPKIEVYFTEEIQHPGIFELNPEFEGIPGFPMEYELNNDNIPQKLKVIEVNKRSVSKKQFEIPKDYEQHQKLEIEENYRRKN
ncbi:MAG: hypothetical protein ACEPOW_04630 [Bacteroidales bacterium]